MSTMRYFAVMTALGACGCMSLSSQAATITYVDADFAGNTTLADGTAMNLVADEAAVSDGMGNPEDYYVTNGTVNTTGLAPDNWGERTRSSVNGPSVLVGPQTADGDAPELRTRLTGLADGQYNLYAYFISPTNGAWRLQAGLNQGSLTEFIAGTNASLAVASDFADVVDIQDSPGLDLYQASLGTAVVSGGTLDFYIDDVSTDDQRTWYEGVGYEAVPEPGAVVLLALAGVGLAAIRPRKEQ